MSNDPRSNVLKAALVDALKPLGFFKKSSSWYKQSRDVIFIVNLQKSDYSLAYYINLAIWMKRYGNVKFPKYYQSQIQARATSLSSRGVILDHILNIEDHPMSYQEIKEEIYLLIKEVIIPFFDSFENENRIKISLALGDVWDKSGVFIFKQVKDELLGES